MSFLSQLFRKFFDKFSGDFLNAFDLDWSNLGVFSLDAFDFDTFQAFLGSESFDLVLNQSL